MKLVHISGSTKGEYLVDSSKIKITLTGTGVEPLVIGGDTGSQYVVKEENGVLLQDKHGMYITGGLAEIPAYNDGPVHWSKHLLVPDGYTNYRIESECEECQELYASESYRNMIMSGTFDNDPVRNRPRSE